jgi:hypothetical protein
MGLLRSPAQGKAAHHNNLIFSRYVYAEDV